MDSLRSLHGQAARSIDSCPGRSLHPAILDSEQRHLNAHQPEPCILFREVIKNLNLQKRSKTFGQGCCYRDISLCYIRGGVH